MGKVMPGEEEPRKTFVGIAVGDGGQPPTLNEALESAAERAIAAGIISTERTAWFDISFIEVELGNQHPRTFKVAVTQKPPGS